MSTNTEITKKPELNKQLSSTRALGKMNFILMGASAVIIIAGFLLMLGSGNDGAEFNAEIFSSRRIVVGPTIAFIGFIAMGVAIMWPARHK
ncbi:MAG: DUF3098 domain-containing protein [Muribaculaceae bacterium]|nr:DUF3098 domain-containing protein [Muribaculaceae bacterium]